MIRVLYVINHAGKAGTERYVQTLVEKLNNKKIRAYFVYNENGLLADNLKLNGIRSFNVKMRFPMDIIAAFKISRICKKLAIDVIHTQFLRENYICILSKIFNPNVKVVYTNHFVLVNSTIVKMFNRIFTKFQYKIIAVCNKGKEVLISNKMDGSKITVIFNGVDLEFWNDGTDSNLRKELGLSSDTFVILCSSRFAHDKGHEFLIKAIAELKKIIVSNYQSIENLSKKIKFILSNDGPLLKDSINQVEELGICDFIEFIGFREDVKNLLHGSDLYVNCSQHEALSFAIIEALACGKPVIATDIPGNRDIINPSQKCGVMVNYGDEKSLAENIMNIINNKELYQLLSNNAIKVARDKFNLDDVVSQTYNLYR